MSDAPRDIQALSGDRALRVVWTDGQAVLPFRFLRGQCDCAHCVNEWTGERIVDPDAIAENIAIERMELVGNYAIRIHWSDGHHTGLYTWQRLRSLEPPV
ncbi:MAG: DUF971 domain-containing protein [Planctomycetota bacterium]